MADHFGRTRTQNNYILNFKIQFEFIENLKTYAINPHTTNIMIIL